MKKSIIIASMFLGACATTGSTGSKGSSGAFQGTEAVAKRRKEIFDAASVANDCLKNKDAGKGGVFAVSADAAGKLSAQVIHYEGSNAVAQCVVDAAAKSSVTPLAGPPVGVIWEFWAEGADPGKQDMPKDIETAMQGVQNTLSNEVDGCYSQNLPTDFPGNIAVSFFVGADGNIYSATVVDSEAKDGGYESCVRNAVSKAKFPALDIEKPVPLTLNWKRGRHS